MRFRYLAPIVLTLGALLAASSATASAVSPHPAVTTPLLQFVPVAGSPTALVYETVQAGLSQPVKGNCGPYAGQCQPQRLMLRDAAGHETVLADLTSIDAPLVGWSLSGNLLTAVRSDDETQVYWWDISGSDHGQLTIPAGSYVSAAPSGVVYFKYSGDVRVLDTAGNVTTLTHIVGHNRRSGLHGAANANGVVISRLNEPTFYLPFATPKHTVKLAKRADCWQLSAKYAACTTRGNALNRPNRGELISLDGSKVKRFDVPNHYRPMFGPNALQGGRTLAGQTVVDKPDSTAVLACEAFHAKQAVVGSRGLAIGLTISALGKVVTVSASGHKLLMTSTCPKTTVIDSTLPV